VLTEAAFSEYLRALEVVAGMSGPPSSEGDEQADIPAPLPDTVEAGHDVAIAAQVLTDRAAKAASEAARVLREDYLTRSDEALAQRLLTEYGDTEGFCVLVTGGPEGFDPRAYFESRVRRRAPVRKYRAKAKATEAADPKAVALRRLKDNVRSARARLKKAAERLANAEEAQAEAVRTQAHGLLLRNELPHGPLPSAREAHAAAEATLRKAEEALRATERR
jgi:hypothetical protein